MNEIKTVKVGKFDLEFRSEARKEGWVDIYLNGRVIGWVFEASKGGLCLTAWIGKKEFLAVSTQLST